MTKSTRVEPGVIAARAEHSFADEAGVLGHLLRRRVLHVGAELEAHDCVVLQQPPADELQGSVHRPCPRASSATQ